MRTFRVVVNGSEYHVEIEELGGTMVGLPQPAPAIAQPARAASPVATQPRPAPVKPAAPQAAAGTNTVVAPMPGTVLKIGVAGGDKVSKGQMLLVLEAMKMENEILAPEDGVVGEVLISQGAAVNAGDILIVLAS